MSTLFYIVILMASFVLFWMGCGSSEIQFIHLIFWEHINTIKMQLFCTLPVIKKKKFTIAFNPPYCGILYRIWHSSLWNGVDHIDWIVGWSISWTEVYLRSCSTLQCNVDWSRQGKVNYIGVDCGADWAVNWSGLWIRMNGGLDNALQWTGLGRVLESTMN